MPGLLPHRVTRPVPPPCCGFALRKQSAARHDEGCHRSMLAPRQRQNGTRTALGLAANTVRAHHRLARGLQAGVQKAIWGTIYNDIYSWLGFIRPDATTSRVGLSRSSDAGWVRCGTAARHAISAALTCATWPAATSTQRDSCGQPHSRLSPGKQSNSHRT